MTEKSGDSYSLIKFKKIYIGAEWRGQRKMFGPASSAKGARTEGGSGGFSPGKF